MTLIAEVTRLYSAYSVGLDTQDPDLFLGCFTDDALVESRTTTARGHDELRTWMALSPVGNVHQSFNILVLDDSGPDMLCRADWHVYEDGAVILAGTYRDSVRADEHGRLRFSRRSITFAWRRGQPPAAHEVAQTVGGVARQQSSTE